CWVIGADGGIDDRDASEVAAASIDGATDDRLGEVALRVFDVDGDGFDDVIVADEGHGYVFAGPLAGGLDPGSATTAWAGAVASVGAGPGALVLGAPPGAVYGLVAAGAVALPADAARTLTGADGFGAAVSDVAPLIGPSDLAIAAPASDGGAGRVVITGW
ncbi:MAG: hypothetical protein ABMB14_34005, partial [Myxococcota bacterium]